MRSKRRGHHGWLVCIGCVAAAAGLAAASSVAEEKRFDPKRWEQVIAKFEEADRKEALPEGAIVFVGSSSIRMWKLDKSFPELKAINRGFGGSHMADSVYYADRIVIKYKPRMVVLYAGDNDIAGGKSPERVLKDFQAFVKKVQAGLPKTRIAFIAIKPSIRRWQLVDKMRQANELIADFVKKDDRLVYVDVFGPMLDGEGKPRKELFIKDGLHLNAKGYALWSSILRPVLTAGVK